MEASPDLNTFANILTAKGYTGYFHTQGAYPGKLEESISAYLESCQKGTDVLPNEDLLLTGYLQWSGEDKPYVACNMWVKYQDGKFSLNKMQLERKDRFGQVLKKSELDGLSVSTVPKVAEAVGLVAEKTKQIVGKNTRRFRL